LKRVCTIALICMSLLCIILFRVNLRQAERIKSLESSLPTMLPGEKIHYFDVLGINNNAVDAKLLNESKSGPFLLFLFQQGCTPCNKNLYYWRKMAEILKNDVQPIGVVLESFDHAASFSEKSGLNFNLYVPTDLNLFKKKMKMRYA